LYVQLLLKTFILNRYILTVQNPYSEKSSTKKTTKDSKIKMDIKIINLREKDDVLPQN